LLNSISSCFRDILGFTHIGVTTYDIDLSMSCDVIGHVTIRFPIGHFVLAVFWNQASVSNGYRDIQWRM